MGCSDFLRPARRLSLLLSCLYAAACGPSNQGDAPLRIAAAASLQGVAQDLATHFEELEGVQVLINCAGSNALALQIEAAGQGDVFLSADEEWVDYLAQKNRLWEGSEHSFLSNRLVVAAHRDRPGQPESLDQLPTMEFEYLALANPSSVPAGRYAKQLLQRIQFSDTSLWDALTGRLAPCLDVRAAAAMARSNPNVLALIYSSELQRLDSLRPLIPIPEGLQPSIVYRAALIRDKDSATSPRGPALKFMAFLSTPRALEIYQLHGFEQSPARPR